MRTLTFLILTLLIQPTWAEVCFQHKGSGRIKQKEQKKGCDEKKWFKTQEAATEHAKMKCENNKKKIWEESSPGEFKCSKIKKVAKKVGNEFGLDKKQVRQCKKVLKKMRKSEVYIQSQTALENFIKNGCKAPQLK